MNRRPFIDGSLRFRHGGEHLGGRCTQERRMMWAHKWQDFKRHDVVWMASCDCFWCFVH